MYNNMNFDIDNLSDNLKTQLELINNSQYYMTFIIIGILLRYKSLDVQRDILINKAINQECFEIYSYPNVFQMQAVSSILVLYALVEFYNQSKDISNQAKCSGVDTYDEDLEVLMSGIVIIIAIIRFFQFLKNTPDQTIVQEENDIYSI